MISSRYRLKYHHLSRNLSSFNIDIVQKDYVKRTEWAASNYGHKGPPFTMVLPPPNVTGKLHLGHALTATIEDSFCRHHRIKGGRAEWIPGFDHAGIATQSVVERKLWSEQKVTRSQLSQTDFLEQCRLWSQTNSGIIREQLHKMGVTLNWDRRYYTLDEKFSKAVTRAFCQLHKQKLIYRDKRLVHWCPSLKSSLSDQEVERIDAVDNNSTISIPAPGGGKRQLKLGKMFVIRYPLESGGYLEVGTTRPETIFADVALAVHPEDDRYKKFIGKRARHPILSGIFLPIVADIAVIRDKGTGVLKITPTHDFLDYQIFTNHRSRIVSNGEDVLNKSCIDEAGKLTNVPHEFEGLDRFDARIKVIDILKSLNLLGEEMQHDQVQVTICSRTGDIIEPRLTEQWFMDTREMHSKVQEAFKTNLIKLTPSFYEGKLHDWLNNQDPWCLSRHLDWGHRIPAYLVGDNTWIVAETSEEAIQAANRKEIVQDVDVLDTWFSSSLVPLVTSGWMDSSFNPSQIPLSLMETGWDILGFWVVRMIGMSMLLTNQAPFKMVVLHGLIRDQAGRKMSKSLGNVIDPLDILEGISLKNMLERLNQSALNEKEKEIARNDLQKRYPEGITKSGADALRFALLRHDVLSTDIPLNIVDHTSEGLRFCNKLWNLANYMEQIAEKCHSSKEKDSDAISDKWILSKFVHTLGRVEHHMTQFAPHLAFNALHQFILSNLCDVYIETTKQALWNNDTARLEEIRTTLKRVVQPAFVQLSVFMPFIAEHLYERVFKREPGSIHSDFVKASFFSLHKDAELEEKFNLALAVISATRSIRQQLELPNKMEFEAVLVNAAEMEEFTEIFYNLASLRLKSVVKAMEDIPKGYIPCSVPGSNVVLALKIEDVHRTEFVARLQRLLQKTEEKNKLFTVKSRKYKDIAQRDTIAGNVKQAVILKSVRKSEQAAAVAKSSAEEAARLKRILVDIN